MRIDNDSRVMIWWDAELTFDPAGSTVALKVNGVTHAMTWQGTPSGSGTKWTQTARTTAAFIGSSRVVTGSDVALTVGRHVGEPVVTLADGQVVPCYPTIPIDVE